MSAPQFSCAALLHSVRKYSCGVVLVWSPQRCWLYAVHCAIRSQARELIVARVRQCADVHAEGLMTALEAHLEQLEMHYRVRALVPANQNSRLSDLVDCSSKPNT